MSQTGKDQLGRIITIIGLVMMVGKACQINNDRQARINAAQQNIRELPQVIAPGKTYQRMILEDETVMEYALVLPEGFTAEQNYPILLALPPGVQTKSMVDAGLVYWQAEAMERGWIVVSPVGPNFTLFFRGAERYLPEFLSRIARQYPPEGGMFHVGGVSNGGISAFRFAVSHPELVKSVVVLPGYALDGYDMNNLVNLKEIPVAMFVGENDGEWVSRMEATEAALSDLGVEVSLDIQPGEGHFIRSVDGEELFDLLEGFRE